MHSEEFPIVFLEQYSVEKLEKSTCDTMDVIYILDGDLELLYDDGESRTYSRKDITIISVRKNYAMYSKKNALILKLCIEASFVQKYFGIEHMIFCDSSVEPNRDYQPLRKLLLQMYNQYKGNDEGASLSVYSMLFELFAVLQKEFSFRFASMYRNKSEKITERMAEIQNFIEENFAQEISLDDMAEHLGLTPQYLSKFFKNNFQMNFRKYLNLYRIRRAECMIRYSDMSLTEIAFSHGFVSIASFNRYFQKIYHMSPREYKKMSVRKKNFEKPLQENVRKGYLTVETTANMEERSIVIEPKKNGIKSIQNPFCKMINVGMAKTLLHYNIQEQLIQLQKELHFSYVRIECFLSNALIPRTVEKEDYCFTATKSILDFLCRNNLIPFIELGKNTYVYMKEFGQNMKGYSYSVNPKFHCMLEAFCRFVSEHYDREWCGKWIFELWKPENETVEQYLKGYEIIKELIGKYLPGAKLGGPGYDVGRTDYDLSELLRGFAAKKLVPDFISAHLLQIDEAGEERERQLILPSSKDDFRKKQKELLVEIRKVWKNCPLYITELNSCMVPRTYVTASRYQAAFLCYNLLRLREDSPMIGYWMIMDSYDDVSSPKIYRTPGIGLLSHEGIRLPAYFAYDFLEKMGKEIVEEGDGYCVTRSRKDQFQILAYTHVFFSDYSFLLNEQGESLQDVYGCFPKTSPISMTFHLKGIKNGIYRIHRCLLDSFHGSVLDIVQGEYLEGSISEIEFVRRILSFSEEEKKYLSETCVPEERTTYQKVEEGELTVSSALEPHSVCLWEISLEI